MKTTTQTALNTAGIRPFDSQSSDPKWNAQRNLQGRTHYVDDDTLKGFQCRILSARNMSDGLVFYLVESVNSRPDHGGYNKRFVAFDVFGTVLTGRDEWFRTREQAYKAGMAFLSDFDAEAHTIATLRRNAERAIADANAILATLA